MVDAGCARDVEVIPDFVLQMCLIADAGCARDVQRMRGSTFALRLSLSTFVSVESKCILWRMQDVRETCRECVALAQRPGGADSKVLRLILLKLGSPYMYWRRVCSQEVCVFPGMVSVFSRSSCVCCQYACDCSQHACVFSRSISVFSRSVYASLKGTCVSSRSRECYEEGVASKVDRALMMVADVTDA